MEIKKLVLGACITNCYIVGSERKNCVIIDPADEAQKIIDEVEQNGWTVKYIFITHGHTDHILALEAVKEYFHAPVVISQIDAWRLEDEELINERSYVKTPYRGVKPDILIKNGDTLAVDELNFRFYGMPGHTDGSMAIVLGRIIFTGDTLLKENHGKTTLPGGDENKLIASINRLAEEFTGDYRILTGHRDETTLEHEREWNPYINIG
ncbi:MAG: MBL fold metallo-hydrolase [Lachnospiraceae bacterium]|nr:MBL fold metallo-hydrolase [Lachnospiraceae bacterium]